MVPLPARGTDGLFEKNRKGIMLCEDFFRGTCSKGRMCPMAHQCRLCLMVHNEAEHNTKGNTAKGGGKGSRTGRGKG